MRLIKLVLCLFLVVSLSVGCQRAPAVGPEPAKSGSANKLASTPLEQHVMWSLDLPPKEWIDSYVITSDGTIFMLVTLRLDASTYVHKLYGIDGRTGEMQVERDVTGDVLLSVVGIAYAEDSELLVIGRDGPVVLPSCDIEAWNYPLRIQLTNSGYIVFGGRPEIHVAHVDSDGQVLWEKPAPRRTQSAGVSYEAPSVRNQLLIDEDKGYILMYGPFCEGLHALSLDTGEELFRYDLPRANVVSTVVHAPEGGYYVGGWTWDTEGNVGVVARISSTGEEISRYDQLRFVAQMGVSQHDLSTCWFIAGEGIGGRSDLYKWQAGADPVVVVEDVGFYFPDSHLIVLDDMVLVSSQKKDPTILQHDQRSRSGGFYVIKNGQVREYVQEYSEHDARIPLLLGVVDNKVIMLSSSDPPHRIMAIRLDD